MFLIYKLTQKKLINLDSDLDEDKQHKLTKLIVVGEIEKFIKSRPGKVLKVDNLI